MKRRPVPADFDYDPESQPAYTVTEPVTKAALKKMTLLDKLEKLISIAEDCKLNDDFFQIHHNLIQSVADELQLTPKQTILLLPFISDSGNIVNKNDLMRFFSCSSIALMRNSEDLNTLLHRRYLIRRDQFNGSKFIKY